MPITMYTTQWCGFCKRLKAQLSRVGVEMTEVDIERDQAAAEFVMSVNGGNQTVPTVVIVGALMMVYVLFGGMTATTWVQIIKAGLLLGGATFMAVMVMLNFGFSPEADSTSWMVSHRMATAQRKTARPSMCM